MYVLSHTMLRDSAQSLPYTLARHPRSSPVTPTTFTLCSKRNPNPTGPVSFFATGKILNIPIYATTQNAARLGATVPEIVDLLPSDAVSHDKTAFSMLTPDLLSSISSQCSSPASPLTVMITGIETHICVTQTTLDLLSRGHKVYIIADGVSSCNRDERPIALARLAREGAVVTTSESVMFELLGDAKHERFREVSGLVRESKEETRVAVETFCRL